MERFVRLATPLILLLLALLVWFEGALRNEDATPWLGETGVIRFTLGVLCLFVLMTVVEQQRMGAAFREVLKAFQRFHEARPQSPDTNPGQKREAVQLLIAALHSQEPKTRDNAHRHLQRLTGANLGPDPKVWQEWLEHENRDKEP